MNRPTEDEQAGSVTRGSWAAALFVVALAAPLVAHAQPDPGCPPEVVAWATSCAAGDTLVQAAACPSGHVRFIVGPGRVAVDVTRRPGEAFVAAGELGASPIGDFPDWSAVPEPDRAAFDALVTCLRSEPAALVDALSERPEPAHGSDAARDPALPWRLLLGLTLAIGLAVRRFGPVGLARRAPPLAVLVVVTFVARRLAVPNAFFHQNGQGPMWISHALGVPSSYGPGFEQVFGLAARAGGANPDGAVFLLQSLLAALVPAAIFVVVRGTGARIAIAWALALATLASPIEARLAASESYFATIGSCLAIAAAILGASAQPEATRSERATAAAAAGLLVAQAALIHPVAWVAASTLPLVLSITPGNGRERLERVALAAGVVGVVVATTAGLDMRGVIGGSLGEQWLGAGATEHVRPREIPMALWIAMLGAAVALVSSVYRRTARRFEVALVGVVLVLVLAWRANLLGAAPPWIHHAYVWLYAAPFAALLAGMVPREPEDPFAKLATERSAYAIAAGLVLLSLASDGLHHDETSTRPTDQREQAYFLAWREHVPEHGTVVWIERVGDQIVSLPVYGRAAVPLHADETPPDLTTLGDAVFLAHTSLCSSSRGRLACDRLEADYTLETFATARLPAVPSMRNLGYDHDVVEITLYRVLGRRSVATTDERSSEGTEGR